MVYLETAVVLSRALAIPAGTIRQWASRGLLQAASHDGAGRPLYDAAAVCLLRATRPARHR